MRTLSRAQITALKYANGRQLYEADINSGNGNLRRTLLRLIKHSLLGWDPIYHGRIVLTDLGKHKLAEARERDRPGILRIKDVGAWRVITLTGVDKEEP
jgi:hypothetical protein